MSGGGFRVSIPNSLRKTIQNIKEITGNHSEEEIYAMLKECSMDPNETAQKLLLQDTFHEVKSKRDKRKESLSNRESAESRWRPGMQGRGSRGGRGNYSARYASHDAGGGKNSAPGKQNGGNQVIEKGGSSSSVSPQETKSKDMPSSVPVIANGPTAIASGGTSVVDSSHITAEIGQVKHEVLASFADVNAVDSALPSNDAKKKPSIAFGTAGTHGQPTPNSNDSLTSTTPASSSAGCFSSSDPVLLPSSDPRIPCAVGTIKREVGSQRTPGEQNAIPAETKSPAVSEVSSAFLQGKMPIKSLGGGKNQLSESSQPSSATHGTSSLSRPSSNYSSRSQQVIGPPRVASNKEWKPKPTNPAIAQGPGSTAPSEVPAVSIEASAQPQPGSNVLDSEEATTKLQKKLEELHLPQRQHVILPNHIHVPESERTKLSFGSFGANFGLTTSYVSGSENDNSSTPASETSQVVEETVVEEASSNQNALVNNEEGNFPDQTQSTTPVTENLSPGDGDVSASAVQEYNESKQDTALLPGGHQYSVVHTSPNYNFGFVSPMFGSQLAPFENSESQARDVPRLPGFVVQQPFDPASYYAQFYRSGTESDGRLSPFPSPGVATKYNGNVAVLPPQTSQSPQEGANSLVISTVGPTPLVTQAAGLVQSSLAVTQQPIPVFRPPAGMHISHYPPNYLPYGHYFSPFYVPPPIHQFLSNGAFPQQPQAGNVYPAPPAAAATGVKYPLPQYKPGGNTGNSAHIGMPSGYGPYGSSPANYNPSSAATTGNSTPNEDLGASQFKDNNAYITGQQSEGSAVWIGRDISNMPASSFYNLPPQGQHMAFTPTQAGHGTFAGIYHPAQAVTAATVHPLLQQSQTMAGAVDMAGPGASAYQQPQHSQINWPSNY